VTMAQAIAQLRHLYQQLSDGSIQDQQEVATGLLGPVIVYLELESAKPRLQAPTKPLSLSEALGSGMEIEEWMSRRK